MRRLGLHLRSSLWEMTPRNHRQSDQDFRRRQVVSVVVILVGARRRIRQLVSELEAEA